MQKSKEGKGLVAHGIGNTNLSISVRLIFKHSDITNSRHLIIFLIHILKKQNRDKNAGTSPIKKRKIVEVGQCATLTHGSTATIRYYLPKSDHPTFIDEAHILLMGWSEDLTAVTRRARATVPLAIVNNSGDRGAGNKAKTSMREGSILILITNEEAKGKVLQKWSLPKESYNPLAHAVNTCTVFRENHIGIIPYALLSFTRNFAIFTKF